MTINYLMIAQLMHHPILVKRTHGAGWPANRKLDPAPRCIPTLLGRGGGVMSVSIRQVFTPSLSPPSFHHETLKSVTNHCRKMRQEKVQNRLLMITGRIPPHCQHPLNVKNVCRKIRQYKIRKRLTITGPQNTSQFCCRRGGAAKEGGEGWSGFDRGVASFLQPFGTEASCRV